MIKRTLILMLTVSCCAFAQNTPSGASIPNQNAFWISGLVAEAKAQAAEAVTQAVAQVPGQVAEAVNQAVAQVSGQVSTIGAAALERNSPPVVGAPYSATITNESIQTLADGNRIVQSSTGTIARDSQGRTRQDAPLPMIGNLAAANAPHLVFIRDPVAQTSLMLNLTEKIAQKMPAAPPLPPLAGNLGEEAGPGPVVIQMGSGAGPIGPPPGPPATAFFIQRNPGNNNQDQEITEVLGSQTMAGVLVNGVRTTHTIPAGQIGNDQPIKIVTEVWTSPDLQTIVYSKRSDPRMGDQTFQLTNIQRAEPDPSLFTVPADFKIMEGPQNIIYRTNQ